MERVYFGIPSPKLESTLSSGGNQLINGTMPISPQSADFNYMFKQEIKIGG